MLLVPFAHHAEASEGRVGTEMGLAHQTFNTNVLNTMGSQSEIWGH